MKSKSHSWQRHVFSHETRNEESLTVVVYGSWRRQTAVLSADRWGVCFGLIVHTPKIKCNSLTYVLTTDVFYVQVFPYAVSGHLYIILVVRLLFGNIIQQSFIAWICPTVFSKMLIFSLFLNWTKPLCYVLLCEW